MAVVILSYFSDVLCQREIDNEFIETTDVLLVRELKTLFPPSSVREAEMNAAQDALAKSKFRCRFISMFLASYFSICVSLSRLLS